MAIDLSAYSAPLACPRKTLHATAGNLDVLTLPDWARQVTIRAAGSGNVKLTHTGSQDAAIGTDYLTIPSGASANLKGSGLASYPLRITGTVNADPVEFVLERGED